MVFVELIKDLGLLRFPFIEGVLFERGIKVVDGLASAFFYTRNEHRLVRLPGYESNIGIGVWFERCKGRGRLERIQGSC